MEIPGGASIIEVGTTGVTPGSPQCRWSRRNLCLSGEEMAASVMKDRFQLNTPGSVNSLVGNRTGNFLLVEPLEM